MSVFSHYSFRLLCILSLFLSSCFLLGSHVDKAGTIVAYKKGLVSTLGKGSFRVAPLGDDWMSVKTSYRALLFQNKKDGSTIFVDSWCRGALNDADLKTLARELVRGVDGFKILQQKSLTLDGRATLRTRGRGFMDGKSVYLDYYVFKKDSCMFDFLYTGESDSQPGIGEFENFAESFRLIKSPEIL